MFKRALDLPALLRRKSFFLLGPRQTGKSTLLRLSFPSARYVDLLEADTFRELSAHPEKLRQSLLPRQKILIVDEIQKLSSLLDEIQILLDRDKRLRVVLTGSSARKLKHGHANLLGGRAWVCRLHPLVSPEVPEISLKDRANRGGLPPFILSRDYQRDIRGYIGTYLQEEIRAEGLARSIENFSRFLEVAGLASGEQVNFTAVASDAEAPARTVREHYQILKDTLVGDELPAYQKTARRKPASISKFCFFDVGVANILKRQTNIETGSAAFGGALENLIFNELRAYLDYHLLDDALSFWRTLPSGLEVDFIIGDKVAIEVKAKTSISPRDCRGLIAIAQERRWRRRIIVCLERRRRITDEGIEILPVEDFFSDLWNGAVAH
jgi:predicted AAA+ superfamily ATPase